MRKSEYKILSFSTTMRNPQRIAELCPYVLDLTLFGIMPILKAIK